MAATSSASVVTASASRPTPIRVRGALTAPVRVEAAATATLLVPSMLALLVATARAGDAVVPSRGRVGGWYQFRRSVRPSRGHTRRRARAETGEGSPVVARIIRR